MTCDDFLGGRIQLAQPVEGYRAGIDPIFLAAALHPRPHEKVLDVGAGVGAATLALAHRVPHAQITGIELQPDLVKMAQDNVTFNDFTDQIQMIQGDIFDPQQGLEEGSFDHVMTNPPYYEGGHSKTSPYPGKAQAQTEAEEGLKRWLKFCLKMLKPKGTLTLIHRTERWMDIAAYLNRHVGDASIYPLWPGQEKSSRLMILQGRKGLRSKMRLLPGITVHEKDGKYTQEAEKVLREAQGVVLS